MTYPHPEVRHALGRFVALKVDVVEPGSGVDRLLRRAPLSWTPTFLVTDAGGREVRRWVGFEPPASFVAELELARAAIDRLHGRLDDAFERLERLAAADTPLAAEALYWLGVAQFSRSADKTDLLPYWDEVRARYPGTPWAERADCLDGIRGSAA